MSRPFAAGCYSESSSCEECHRGCWQNELAEHDGRELCPGCALEAETLDGPCSCCGNSARLEYLTTRSKGVCLPCLRKIEALAVVMLAAQRGPRKCVDVVGVEVSERRSA